MIRSLALIGMKMVNMIFYPTCPNPDLTLGVGRHSDMGTLTILLQDGLGGLYVKLSEEIGSGKKGEWIEILLSLVLWSSILAIHYRFKSNTIKLYFRKKNGKASDVNY